MSFSLIHSHSCVHPAPVQTERITMGTLSHTATAFVLADTDTWIEGSALQQLEYTARLPGMVQVAGMPDLHPGRTYPVGAAFFSRGCFYPALVGNDIGCGMALWQTDMAAHRASPAKLAQKLGNIDGPPEADWQAHIRALCPETQGFQAALGTIGGGNHFAELQRIDTVYEQGALPDWFDTRSLQLLVHSGSRGLGQHILSEHVRRFNHGGLHEDSAEAADYLHRHEQALAFARANRRLIAERMLARWHAAGRAGLDIEHNFVEAAHIGGIDGWLHRKGATPSDRGPVVIPGSRGDYSYLVQALAGTPQALFSLAHGAGRKWQRSECRARLAPKWYKHQLDKTRFGSRVVCAQTHLLYEEAPQAYKDIDNIITVLADAGLIRPLARLKPVLTYKTAGGGCG